MVESEGRAETEKATLAARGGGNQADSHLSYFMQILRLSQKHCGYWLSYLLLSNGSYNS